MKVILNASESIKVTNSTEWLLALMSHVSKGIEDDLSIKIGFLHYTRQNNVSAWFMPKTLKFMLKKNEYRYSTGTENEEIKIPTGTAMLRLKKIFGAAVRRKQFNSTFFIESHDLYKAVSIDFTFTIENFYERNTIPQQTFTKYIDVYIEPENVVRITKENGIKDLLDKISKKFNSFRHIDKIVLNDVVFNKTRHDDWSYTLIYDGVINLSLEQEHSKVFSFVKNSLNKKDVFSCLCYRQISGTNVEAFAITFGGYFKSKRYEVLPVMSRYKPYGNIL